MPSIISKIKLINFRRFKDYTLIPNKDINILVGDNEVGKSSILEAITLVSNGSVKKVEAIGIDQLFNTEAIEEFNSNNRTLENLPNIVVELYLEGDFDFSMNGKNNSEQKVCDGIRMVCAPNKDFEKDIADILNHQENDYFPYDYYTVRFSTFADEGYTGYKKKLQTVLIDSTNMNSDYATNDFIRRMYTQYTDNNIKERVNHKSQYRKMKNEFCHNTLCTINTRIPQDKKYTFGLKSASIVGFENDLMIYEDQISIDNKGTGKQVFIKTDFALERSGKNVDVILIEEPENHLSYINLRKLIKTISEKQKGQLFITTHNSYISTRLELNNLHIMSIADCDQPIKLLNLPEETSKYFVKAPPVNMVEFILANKVILLEGPSEYMLLEKFYETITNHKPEEDNVQILDIRGLSFKRYLDIAQLTKTKVAVVTDNDHDVDTNCERKYKDYQEENIKICFNTDNNQYTFEVALYNSNMQLCNDLFGEEALDYMLKNKTEAAYQLLVQKETINVPQYIQEAIEWIRS